MKNQFYDGRLEIECFWQAKILFQQKKIFKFELHAKLSSNMHIIYCRIWTLQSQSGVGIEYFYDLYFFEERIRSQKIRLSPPLAHKG